jgi:hypothetical protein
VLLARRSGLVTMTEQVEQRCGKDGLLAGTESSCSPRLLTMDHPTTHYLALELMYSIYAIETAQASMVRLGMIDWYDCVWTLTRMLKLGTGNEAGIRRLPAVRVG